MIWKHTLILFLLLLTFSQALDLPDDNTLTGWEADGNARVFKKNDLYGYINGGAELFHEFGFEKLTVRNYKNNDQEITLEIFEMESPESALGIYLMKSDREEPVNGIAFRNTGNSYQIKILKSEYYIQVNSFSGDSVLIPQMVTAANFILDQIKAEKAHNYFQYLPEKDLIPGSEFLFRGEYALQPVYTFGKGDIFLLKGQIFGVGAEFVTTDSILYTQMVIPYPDSKTAIDAYKNVIKNLDSYLEKIRQTDNSIVFKDYMDEYGTIDLKDRFLNIKIHLKQIPD